jgi:hypothetical protein
VVSSTPFIPGTSLSNNCTVSVPYTQFGQEVLFTANFKNPSGLGPTGTFRYTMVQQPPAPAVNPVAIPSSGSAFVTWGISGNATSYTVTATPGGLTCTSEQNFCTINGLSNGTSYTFSVVATKNGASSSAVTTSPVSIGSQLEVSGALTSTTWKVGASIIANPIVIGQYSIIRYSWFRCDQVVPTTAAPPACSVIGDSSNTYVIQAADVGKYITAHINVTGGAGVVTSTIGNSIPALAASASGAVPTDPNGKPLVLSIPTNQIPAVSGGTITINGSGFAGVTSVTVDGVVAQIVSVTDTRLVITIPAATAVGLVDLAITTPKGTATVPAALAYTATPVATPITSNPNASNPIAQTPKKKTLSAFAGTATALSSKQKTEIAAFVIANPTLTKLSCAANSDGIKKSSAEVKSAVARAKAACSYATTLKRSLFISTSGKQGKLTGKVSRVVTLTMSN